MHGRGSCWTSWYWQNRDSERHGKGGHHQPNPASDNPLLFSAARQVLCCLQLQSRARLQRARKVFGVNVNSKQNLTQFPSRIYKGLAQSGTWGCFDEFNRIEAAVLSVVATQLTHIQRGLAQKSTELLFEGRQIRLDAKVGFFITMNPGYAGRTELPDNPRAQSRSHRPHAAPCTAHVRTVLSVCTLRATTRRTCSRKVVDRW